MNLLAFVSSFKINKAGHVERFIGVTSQMEDWVSSFLCIIKAMESPWYCSLWPHYHTVTHPSKIFQQMKNKTVFGNLHKISDLTSEKKSWGSVLWPLGHHLFSTMSAVCNEIYTDSIIKALFYNVEKSIS